MRNNHPDYFTHPVSRTRPEIPGCATVRLRPFWKLVCSARSSVSRCVRGCTSKAPTECSTRPGRIQHPDFHLNCPPIRSHPKRPEPTNTPSTSKSPLLFFLLERISQKSSDNKATSKWLSFARSSPGPVPSTAGKQSTDQTNGQRNKNKPTSPLSTLEGNIFGTKAVVDGVISVVDIHGKDCYYSPAFVPCSWRER